jgi:hypothetical protein
MPILRVLCKSSFEYETIFCQIRFDWRILRIPWRWVVYTWFRRLEGPACQVRHPTFDNPRRIGGHDKRAPPNVCRTTFDYPFPPEGRDCRVRVPLTGKHQAQTGKCIDRQGYGKGHPPINFPNLAGKIWDDETEWGGKAR